MVQWKRYTTDMGACPVPHPESIRGFHHRFIHHYLFIQKALHSLYTLKENTVLFLFYCITFSAPRIIFSAVSYSPFL